MVTLLQAVFSGFWLGTLREPDLRSIDSHYFANTPLYLDDKHNTSGLWQWEKDAVERYFTNCRTVLLLAAGGGREYFALSELGYQVDASECNPALVTAANDLAMRLGQLPRVRLATADEVPSGPPGDGAVIGWGAYMLVRGRARRVALLRALHARVSPGGPVLLSLFHRTGSDRRDRLTAAIANAVRLFTGAERAEAGDVLAPN